jgi:hypothetical protein
MTGAGGITDNVNIGAGAGWFAGLLGSVAQFKSVTVSGGLVLTPGASSIDIGLPATIAGRGDIQASWVEKDLPYFRTAEITYVSDEAPSLIFRGSASVGTPTAIKLVVGVSDAAKPCDVRVQDITNGNTIAEITGLTNTARALFDLGAIANIPAGLSVFEVQAKSALGGETHLAALAILF